MATEFAVPIDPAMFGLRHACHTEWEGTNPRRCTDLVCTSEYDPVFNDFGVNRGFRQLCEYLESSHWLLRAARTTHPTVRNVAERMRGKGFSNVPEEDQRLFCRGPGWDGAGSGELEIEGFLF